MRQGADHILLYGFCTPTALYVRTVREIMLTPVENKQTNTVLFKHEIFKPSIGIT